MTSTSSNNKNSGNNNNITTNNNTLQMILKTLKDVQSKVERVIEENDKIKKAVMKLSKQQKKHFEVRKGSYEYNTLVQLLAKLYFTNPTQEVPRQEIYDEMQKNIREYDANSINKMMKFCQTKIQEWR
ncbi:uncharacterized protein [Ptychodera flava]|uniref:uncharacterized protein n=1 Tax=Ptychodera flava TaxID=63121 RepID=UPI003969EB7F